MEKREELPIFELVLKGKEFEGVFATSFVEHPANESNFFAFAKEEGEELVKLALDEEKRMVAGVFLIPEQLIFRKGEEQDYFVKFTKETIAQTAKLFAKNGFHNQFSQDHESPISGAYLVENWLVGETEDKIYSYGFSQNDVPAGSWVGIVYVENDVVWQAVKEGKYNGFSIEGIFDSKLVKASKEEDPMKEIESILFDEELTNEIKELRITKILSANLGEKEEKK